ncbi:polysaccharide lyase family 1 protein [Kitasatospora sp. CMC57]|uniref:Polysaccharide lyase family 1 protein n=1 Tax=Kitasatospora sp. CMC57 TaxID=3231513 RepID=A0AB33K0H6_9ACTN
MRVPRRTALLACTAALLGATCVTVTCATVTPAAAADVAHTVLAAKDGWGSATTGTTGGSKADAAHTVTVTTRAQLVAALGGNNSSNASNATAKIIQVSGTIDLNVNDSNAHLSCANYQTGGYTLAKYLAAYDPAVWGRSKVPSGALEDARAASQKAQAARVQINVGANTTIVGINGGKLLGGGLVVKNVDNVIVRNLTFEDAADCFPQWDPTDGSTGNWNSMYDNLVAYNATHVWVDHNTFTDGANVDSKQPSYFGRPYQVHDGELDVVKGADYVTASWNVFKDHDKTILVGNSDSSTVDTGKLRVTFHHNLWQNTVERAPRVRFGQVDVYNNYFVPTAGQYEYSIGVGKNSKIVAQYNYFKLPSGTTAGQVLSKLNGTALTADNNSVNGTTTDLISAYNAAHSSSTLGASAGWTPSLRLTVQATSAVPAAVTASAGAGRI